MRMPALIFAALLAMAGCASPPAVVRGSKPNATEKMMWSTYALGTAKGAGTGFVVIGTDPRRPGVAVPVIVTAAHLLKSVRKGPLIVAVRLRDQSGELQVAVIPIPLANTRGDFFVKHPRLDIGAFEPSFPPGLGETMLPSFLKEKAVARGREALRAGAEVSFLGFPDALPGSSGGFPILRSGKVASYPTAGLKAESPFLIDADVYPGDSGAPVFTAGRGGWPELTGMIVQRIGRTPETFSHFAIAVDGRAIRETLQLLAERSGRVHPEKKTAR